MYTFKNDEEGEGKDGGLEAVGRGVQQQLK